MAVGVIEVRYWPPLPLTGVLMSSRLLIVTTGPDGQVARQTEIWIIGDPLEAVQHAYVTEQMAADEYEACCAWALTRADQRPF